MQLTKEMFDGKVVLPKKLLKMVTLTLLLLFVCTSSTYAHNLWIVGDADSSGNGTFHLYFEHHVGPGDGAYLGPIEERGKTWLVTPQGDPVSLTMEMVKENDTKFLAGNSGKTVENSYSIDHTSLYGLYNGRLDFFHGRYIEAVNRKSLADLSHSSNLPVQIVPVWTMDGLVLRVMYFSNPRPRADLTLIHKDGSEKNIKANNKGEILLGKVTPGTYFVCTHIIENEPAGAFEYEAYKGIMHGATLTLKITEDFIREK